MTYINSNAILRKSFSFRSKTQGNEKLSLATLLEFVYFIIALVFLITPSIRFYLSLECLIRPHHES